MPNTKRTNGHRPTGLLHLLDPTLKLAPHPKQEDLSFNLFNALDAVVRLTAEIPEDAFSAKTLGQETRESLHQHKETALKERST